MRCGSYMGCRGCSRFDEGGIAQDTGYDAVKTTTRTTTRTTTITTSTLAEAWYKHLVLRSGETLWSMH